MQTFGFIYLYMVQYLYFRVLKSQFKSGSRSLIKRKSIGVERSGFPKRMRCMCAGSYCWLYEFFWGSEMHN